MDAWSILASRIADLDRQLQVADQSLANTEIAQTLRDRVAPAFKDEIANQCAALAIVGEELADQLKAAPKDRVSLDQSWEPFHAIEEKCLPLFREVLAFLEGAAARTRGVDDGLCDLADAMLRDLDGRIPKLNWPGITILAEGEFFEETAEIIRLRFPETSIWNLPIAAHEFGHYLIQQKEVLPAAGRFNEFLQDHSAILPRLPESQKDPEWKLQNRRRRRYLHEHYADAFATFALGPAYACTCLLLRFDPAAAYQDGASHPSGAKRAQVILRVLEEMHETGASRGHYPQLPKRLRDWWSESIAAAKPAGEPPSEETLLGLDELAETLHDRLDTIAREARYARWRRASGLSESLVHGTPNPAAYDVRDILNAAWRRRIEPVARDPADNGATVGDRAKDLARAKLGVPGPGTARAVDRGG